MIHNPKEQEIGRASGMLGEALGVTILLNGFIWNLMSNYWEESVINQNNEVKQLPLARYKSYALKMRIWLYEKPETLQWVYFCECHIFKNYVALITFVEFVVTKYLYVEQDNDPHRHDFVLSPRACEYINLM